MPLPSTDQEVVAIKGALDPFEDRLIALGQRFRAGSVERKRACEAYTQLRRVQDTLSLLGAGF